MKAKEKGAAGGGAVRLGLRRALARPLPLAIRASRSRHFSLAVSGAHARVLRPQLVSPAPSGTFFLKTEHPFCFEKRHYRTFFHIGKKAFVTAPPPLDTIRNNSRIFLSGVRPLTRNRPRPHPFFVCSFLPRAPLSVGGALLFALPPAGAK